MKGNEIMFTVDLKKATNIINNGMEFHKNYYFDGVTMEAFRSTMKDGVEHIKIEFALDKVAFVVEIKNNATANEIKEVLSNKIREMSDNAKKKIEELNSMLSEMARFSIRIE